MDSKARFLAMVAIATGTLLGAVSGCELIANADRNKIENAGGSGGSTTQGGGGTTSEGGGGTTTTPPECVNPVADCDPPSGECKKAVCDAAGKCAEENIADGMDASTQAPGDCKKNVCQGGAIQPANDDADIENDGTDCTTDTCSAGMPMHADVAPGGTCSDNGGKVCDAAGTCVGCNADADCTDAENPKCDTPNNVCVPAACVDLVKNGMETDVDCGGPVCGDCADGLTCANAADCQSNNCGGTTCVQGTCTDGILNNVQIGETDVDCGGPTCDPCAFDEKCVLGTDCIGGLCTDSKCAATCTDTVKNQTESDVDCGGVCNDCINTQMCNGDGDCMSGFCNGGTCAPCANDLQCDATQYCDTGDCVLDKAVGQACSAGTQCMGDNCVDGFCCGAATCGTCESCGVAGDEGVCTGITPGQQDDTCNASGQSCTAMGACKKNDGQVCGAGAECGSGFCIDGFCCNSTCNATCKACNVAGLLGTCSNVVNNQPDPLTCAAAGEVCNGAGLCKKAVGQVCAAGADCLNGQCVDNVCCGTASCATCKSCGLAGSLGTCSDIANAAVDNFPVNACTGNNTCNGTGTCTKNDGQLCPSGMNSECTHGHCVDGVCCNSACTGLCLACNVAASPGTCAPVPAGTDPLPECPGIQTCDGAAIPDCQ